MTDWYLNRFRTIAIPEIPYRIGQLIRKQFEKVFSTGKKLRKQPVNTSKDLPALTLNNAAIYPGTINVFGREFNYSEQQIDWHRDIFTGESFPLKFSKSINIYNTNAASAKAVWEINRLQFLPHLALNYKITGSENYLTRITEIMNSWIGQNPYLIGINWYSNIEVNIRLISWFLCWKILDVDRLVEQRPDFKDFVENRWLPVIYQHCKYSYRNPSKYSSANNHLIAEYAGLFIASSLWKFKESDRWLRYSGKGLEREIDRQHSSGINREEAAEYIQFITDFFLLCYIVGKRTDHSFSKNYLDNLYKIFSYILDFLDIRGTFPNYGDEDDGKCFVIDTDPEFNNFRSLLTSGAIIFNDPAFKSQGNGFDLKNQLLFGNAGKADYDSIPDTRADGVSKFYKNEGHFIFRKKERSGEIYLHFDAAPLGFLSIAAHGHADALSFILRVDGQPVLVDSGTYTYHSEPDWRSYFVGTLAHNTIRINQKDQAMNGGATMWTRHYKSSTISLESDGASESVKATHDGYNNENARHIREVTFNKNENEFQILDTIDIMNNDPVQLEIPFHLHPGVKITRTASGSYRLSGEQGRQTEITIDSKLDPVILKGQLEPQILGWFSGSFMSKEATSVIYCKTTIDRTTTFRFQIKII